ncbi:MAG: lysophospholipid acyltransferase family protein [Chitinophagaceae bacterium]
MYYFYFIIFYLFSLLPLKVLYLLSDFAYFILYHIAGYRKEVVMKNLLQAFPEKLDEERKDIAKRFYRNLSDMMVEAIKMISISRKNIAKQFSVDLTLFDELEKTGRGLQVHLGHYFNWEWANLFMKTKANLPFLVTYMPLSNKAADQLFLKIRSRFGSDMIPANDVQQAMKPWQNKPFINVLVADQNPGNPRRAYWFPFLNKMTAFYKGPELNARRRDMPVVYGEIKKLKRGKYHITFSLISGHPQQEKEGFITEKFVQLLEAGIKSQPENWVWSHRRWKHEWKGDK